MMEILILSVGEIKEYYNELLIKDYIKRINKYARIKEITIKDWASDDALIVMRKESERLLEVIDQNYYNIILDINGESIDSIQFAKRISDINTYNNSKICFIIGGSHGVLDIVREKCNYRLSFSKMTFPHQLMKGILLEQIYRACKIINNERYHK